MGFRRGSNDERRLYAQKSLIFDATELVAEAMTERGWTRKKLADALGVRPSEITQRLQGKRNFTLTTLADMLHVMDYKVQVSKIDHESQMRSPAIPLYLIGGYPSTTSSARGPAVRGLEQSSLQTSGIVAPVSFEVGNPIQDVAGGTR